MNRTTSHFKWLCLLVAIAPAAALANQNPVANNIFYSNIEDTPRYHNVLFNDSDPDGDKLFLHTVTSPSHGSTSKSGFNILYQPDANYCGVDSFKYQNKDRHGAVSNIATITVDVSCRNDAPVANNIYYDNIEDTARYHSVLFNDTDVEGDSILLHSVGSASHGTTTQVDNDVLYVPESNFCGTDSFTYQNKDVYGAVSNVATITIGVACTNDAPVANNIYYDNIEDISRYHNVLFNDFDIDGDVLSLHLVGPADYGTTSRSGNNVYYVPNTNFCGSDSFTYYNKDPSDVVSNQATITLEGACVNDLPVAENDQLATDQDAPPKEFDVLTNDTDDDDDDILLLTGVGVATSGKAYLLNNQVGYTPNPHFCGADSFTYTLSDGQATTSATVDMTVNCKLRPNAVDDSFTVAANTGSNYKLANGADDPATLAVLANDNSQTHLVAATAIAPHSDFGSYYNKSYIDSNSNTIKYIPKLEYCGPDEITYRSMAANGNQSTPAIVKILVDCGVVSKAQLNYFDGLYSVRGTVTAQETFADLSILHLNSQQDNSVGNKIIYLTVNKSNDNERPCVTSGCSLTTYAVAKGDRFIDAVNANSDTVASLFTGDIHNGEYRINMIAVVDGVESPMTFRRFKYQHSHGINLADDYDHLVVAYSYNVDNCTGLGSKCVITNLGEITLGENNTATLDFKVYQPFLNKPFTDKAQYWNCNSGYDSKGYCISKDPQADDVDIFNSIANAAKWRDYNTTINDGVNGKMTHPYFPDVAKSLFDAKDDVVDGLIPINSQLQSKYGEIDLNQFGNNINDAGEVIFTEAEQGALTVPRPFSVVKYEATYQFNGNNELVISGTNTTLNLVFKLGDLNTKELYLDTAKSNLLSRISSNCLVGGCFGYNIRGFAFLSKTRFTNFNNAEQFESCYQGEQLENDVRSVISGDRDSLEQFITLDDRGNASYKICPSKYTKGSKVDLSGNRTTIDNVIGKLTDCRNRVVAGLTNTNYCYEHLGLPSTASVTLTEKASHSGQAVTFDYNFIPFQGAHIYDTDFSNNRSYEPILAPVTGRDKTIFNGPFAVDHDEAAGGHRYIMLGAGDGSGKIKGMVFIELSYDHRFPIIAIGYNKAVPE